MTCGRSLVASCVLGVGLGAPAAAEAWAELPVEKGQPVGVVPHDPPVSQRDYPEYEGRLPVADDSITDEAMEALQLGVTAAGGAGIALVAVWMHGRRQPRVR
jgi:hypothetical protein